MSNPQRDLMRQVLGPTLGGGALRAIGILAAFALIGGTLAWLVH